MSDFATRAIHHLGARIVKILWPDETVRPASEMNISWQMITAWVFTIKTERDRLEKDLQRERAMCEYAMARANDLSDKRNMALRTIDVMRENARNQERAQDEILEEYARDADKLKEHAHEADQIIATIRAQRDQYSRSCDYLTRQRDIAEALCKTQAEELTALRAELADFWGKYTGGR